MAKRPKYERIYGRHPVEEVLRAGHRKVHRLLVNGVVRPSIAKAAERLDIPLEPVERSVLDGGSDHHQGVAAVVEPYPYSDLHQILEQAKSAAEEALILLLDQVQDPQNLGTLLRSAEAMGVQGVLLPKRSAAGVTPAVVAASAGASEYLLLARTNLAAAIRKLKEIDIWVVGLEYSEHAADIDQVDLQKPLALVVGSEGHGLRRLVRESCDYLVRIPMRGSVASLNAAMAGSIALYEARRGSRVS